MPLLSTVVCTNAMHHPFSMLKPLGRPPQDLPASRYHAGLVPNTVYTVAQRAHGNFIENQGSFLGALLISGLRYPTTAAVLGAGWVLARIVYAFGYTGSKGPAGRLP